MRLRLRLDGRKPRRWHVRLAERAAALPGIVIEIDRRPGQGPESDDAALPAKAALLFRLEALLNRRPLDGLWSPVSLAAFAAFPPPSTTRPDIVIDLCGDVPVSTDVRIWRLAFDGHAGEAGLLGSLLAGRAPLATLAEDGRVIAAGRYGTEAGGVALTSFEDGLARTTTLILSALAGTGPRLDAVEIERAVAALPTGLGAAALGKRAGKLLARSIVRRLYHLCYRAPHWRVGWRRLDGPDLVDLRTHPESGWRDLPDDGHRFYADPFPIDHAGGTMLFVEEYPHATGKAILSAVAFGPDGPLGTPVPVLEEPYHLSYPFVFERDGTFWMIPESCANGTIDLYRSTAFPGGWIKEATLVSEVTASDTTLVEHGGRWWMFATVRDAAATVGEDQGIGSFSDALHLWSAADFRGPWVAHPANPVLVDIASARPAGHIVSRGGALIRPVQDCRKGYGEALALARIDRLDMGGYAQTVETTLRAGPRWKGSRLHTLNRSAAFEFIDGSARAPRFRRS
ncbi:formyl transferase [Methylobacterium sp. BTF04]|uniref:glucosamine inositolphosphorylceramide transferase family protein n=1 Tax=Methylobacterium sp. BTF04 TaxID=2708300 RepID=UPI0013CF9BA2|nr:formyl transferase [Methylobacterium sp. BTF04]NEU10831.1 formyl transferase [Methylobacterium sp. BTF04]